ncbi:putative cutinase cut2 [Mycobacterium conspicuum]|uniref:Cutinase n=1 Tax=Mycobacterium conspicuum TaxID=44010 RepID=A0A1X1TQC3_9MYCO|nr:cutinase family protein [Mycobacterium conspicuum]ORV46772.1 cutinase [Mycobacterium conspicuum]BBZ40340.1 putative cutinase cut2 [Mycobacterium conspicuum]
MSALSSRRIPSLTAAALSAAVLLTAPVVIPAGRPGAVAPAAASCSDAEVVFARGRMESPGPGQVGNSFISAVRSKYGKYVSSYAVKYPADTEIDVGANDMSQHVQNTINSCPNTRIVLGGYSLGAAVTDVVLAVPMQVFNFNNPLPPGADQHVAAVALFGNGTQWVGPITNFNPAYNDRTIDLCHGADPICNPADPHTWEANWPEHQAGAYISSGMVNQAADFVVEKLRAGPNSGPGAVVTQP